MFELLLSIAIGIVIGWNLPQPPWARDLQNKAAAWLRDLIGKAR